MLRKSPGLFSIFFMVFIAVYLFINQDWFQGVVFLIVAIGFFIFHVRNSD